MGNSDKINARQLAREALAQRNAERVAKEREEQKRRAEEQKRADAATEAAMVGYFEAADREQVAIQAQTAAQLAQAVAVNDLMGLGLKVNEIAELLKSSSASIRALKRHLPEIQAVPAETHSVPVLIPDAQS